MAGKLTVNGNVTASGTLDVSGDTTLSADVKANSDYGSATQIYGVRAYLNYDHANDTIMGSAGVTSINDTAAGRFTINWAFTWPDDNYSLILTSAGPGGDEGDDRHPRGVRADPLLRPRLEGPEHRRPDHTARAPLLGVAAGTVPRTRPASARA